MINYAKNKLPGSYIRVLTNGLLLSERIVDDLYNAGLAWLCINCYEDRAKTKIKNIYNKIREKHSDLRIELHLRKQDEILLNRAVKAPNKTPLNFPLSLFCIDGSAKDYGRQGNADKIQSKVNRLTDLTVYQSYYGKYTTTEKYPIIGNDGQVIYNPVDINLFTPNGERVHYPYKIKICCATFSTNPKKSGDIICDLADKHMEYDFLLCGRYDEAPAKTNIHPFGLLDKYELTKVMRSSDIFLFPSQNETCPNVVIEAMASGLTVIYHPSGGTHEIVGDCGLPLKSWLKNMFRYGKGRARLLKRYKNMWSFNFALPIFFICAMVSILLVPLSKVFLLPTLYLPNVFFFSFIQCSKYKSKNLIFHVMLVYFIEHIGYAAGEVFGLINPRINSTR